MKKININDVITDELLQSKTTIGIPAGKESNAISNLCYPQMKNSVPPDPIYLGKGIIWSPQKDYH